MGIFIISVPGHFAHWTCKYLPETFHENPALHAGHTALHWHLCGGRKGFLDSEPTVMLNFAINLWTDAAQASVARTCMVFRDRSQTPTWPFCDIDISLPVPCDP